jgi:VCBS repeat protein
MRTLPLGLVFVLALVAGRPAHAGLPTFQITQFGFGNGPEAVAVGYFNNDPNLDLAVTNADGNSVSIFIDKADGTGLPLTATRILTGTPANPLKSPQGIAVGDFNHDNKADLAVSNYSGSSVSIFLGNGDGTFSGPTNIAVLKNPLGIAAGIFRTGSLDADIVVADKSGGSNGKVSYLQSSGDGVNFTRADVPTDPTVIDHPRRVLIGDFGTSATNAARDGIPDIAVTAQGGDDAVWIIYGDGTGLFPSARKFGAGVAPNGITSGDFNNDGCSDIVTANHASGGNQLWFLYGACTGADSFLNATGGPVFGSSSNTFGVTAVNLNNDTKLDLAVSNTGGTGTSNDDVRLLVNTTPDGSFGPSFTSSTCTVGDAPKGIVAASLNPSVDTNVDVVVANRNSDNVSVMYLNGTGACVAATQIGQVVAAKKPIALVRCDVTNADGSGGPDNLPDLLVLDQGPPQQVKVFSGDGAGNFAKTLDVNVSGTSATAIACVDRNGDGKSDFAVTNGGSSGNAIICLNNNNATFTCSTLASGLNNPSAIIFDEFCSSTTTPDWAIALKGNDTVKVECFPPAAIPPSGSSPVALASGAFDGTLKDVVVAPASQNKVDLLYQSENFTLARDQSLGNSPTGATNKPIGVASGDLDGDGHTDIVTANGTNRNDVTVLRGLGSKGFASAQSFLAGNSPNSAVIADFDCDGQNDVAVADDRRDEVTILPGTGNLSSLLTACQSGSTSGCEFDAGDGASSIVVGQWNRANDVNPDLAVLDMNSGTLTVLLNCSSTCACPCPPCPVCP